MMSIDLTQVAVALIGLMGTVVTAVVVPWIKSKTTAQQQEIIRSVARTAVFAAEQIYGGGEGQKKKEYARDYVERLLREYKITLGSAEISAAIEAALMEITEAAGLA